SGLHTGAALRCVTSVIRSCVPRSRSMIQMLLGAMLPSMRRLCTNHGLSATYAILRPSGDHAMEFGYRPLPTLRGSLPLRACTYTVLASAYVTRCPSGERAGLGNSYPLLSKSISDCP